MNNLDQYRLGKDNEPLELSTSEDNRQVVLAMAQQAQRSIYIMSGTLDPVIYDHQDLVEALSRLARSHRHAEIHILLQDSEPVAKRGHRLVELANRLSSMVSIRKPDEAYAHINEAFFIADGVGFIKRTMADRFEGVASFHSPMEARELADHFNDIWSRAQPDSQLRRLHL